MFNDFIKAKLATIGCRRHIAIRLFIHAARRQWGFQSNGQAIFEIRVFSAGFRWLLSASVSQYVQ